MTLDQARVIVGAVEALTREHDDLPVDIYVRAKAHLLDLAESLANHALGTGPVRQTPIARTRLQKGPKVPAI